MDAIECGIVKLPRVPVAENIPGNEMPMFRNLWENIRKDMPKKGRGKGEDLDPLKLPDPAPDRARRRSTATTRRPSSSGRRTASRCRPASSSSARTPRSRSWSTTSSPASSARTRTARPRWRTAASRCSATSTRPPATRCPGPNTLLIDSEQLEAGDALDDNFRSMAADEIERFRREIVERTGDARAGENITDQELLREVMNTVGKPGQLGGVDPLRRLGLDAHRRLGRQHRHPRAGRPRLRHPAPLRAGDRPRAAPPVVRPERGGPVQRRIRRRVRHSVRLHRQAGRRAAAAAARDGPGQGRAPRARRPGDPLSRASRATASSCRRSG